MQTYFNILNANILNWNRRRHIETYKGGLIQQRIQTYWNRRRHNVGWIQTQADWGDPLQAVKSVFASVRVVHPSAGHQKNRLRLRRRLRKLCYISLSLYIYIYIHILHVYQYTRPNTLRTARRAEWPHSSGSESRRRGRATLHWLSCAIHTHTHAHAQASL